MLETILHAQTRARPHIYLLQSTRQNDERLRTCFQEKYHEWQFLIREGLNALFGECSEITALAALVLAALDGFVIQSYLGIEAIPVEEVTGWLASKV